MSSLFLEHNYLKITKSKFSSLLPISTATRKIYLLSLFKFRSPPLISRQLVNFYGPLSNSLPKSSNSSSSSSCCNNFRFISPSILAARRILVLQNQGHLRTYPPLSQHHLCRMVVHHRLSLVLCPRDTISEVVC